MLGKNYNTYGEISLCNIKDDISCAICIGGDKNSPSLTFKGDVKTANEDAVFAALHEDLAILAVADSHFGHWASDTIMTYLAEHMHDMHNLESFSNQPEDLFKIMFEQYSDDKEFSETTLIFVTININTGAGTGLSFGDSSAMIVNHLNHKRVNTKNHIYISPNTAPDMFKSMANEFYFTLAPGDVILLFTDGIDECHYGYPETSITDQHIHNLFLANNSGIQSFTSSLASLALQGVNGNPGGQDNLAIASMLFR